MTTPTRNQEPHHDPHSLIPAQLPNPVDQSTIDAHLTASIHATHVALSHLYADISANHRQITCLLTSIIRASRVLIRPVDPQDEIGEALRRASERFLTECDNRLAAGEQQRSDSHAHH